MNCSATLSRRLIIKKRVLFRPGWLCLPHYAQWFGGKCRNLHSASEQGIRAEDGAGGVANVDMGDAAGTLGAAIGKKSPLQLYIRAFKDGIPILIHLLKLKSIGFANR